MEGQYVLLHCCDRDSSVPLLFDTLDEARSAMKQALISAMDGLDDSIFDEYKKDEEYNWEPDGNSAWFNNRHGNHDWDILEFGEILRKSESYKEECLRKGDVVWELLGLFETAIDCEIREREGRLHERFDDNVETTMSEDGSGNKKLSIVIGNKAYSVTIEEKQI